MNELRVRSDVPATGIEDITAEIYETALDPGRLVKLLSLWTGLRDDVNLLELDRHFARARRILAQGLLQQPGDTAERLVASFRTAAAFAINRQGKVIAANPAAERAFDMTGGAGLGGLPLEEDDRAALAEAIDDVQSPRGAVSRLVRCRSTHPTRLVGFEVIGYDRTGPDSFALVATTEPGWTPGMCDVLRDRFGLSNAEMEVLQSLVECQTAKTIARARNRSLDTVRSQIRAILHKTETHSQIELVRLAGAVAEAVARTDPATIATQAALPPSAPTPVVPRTIFRENGRAIEHIVLGDPAGRPVMFLPMRDGVTRLPVEAETYAASLGLRIIVPLRAGFGMSDPVPQGEDWAATISADHKALLDHYRIDTCPVLACGPDSFTAVSLAARYPDRVTAILLAGLVLPSSSPTQVARMSSWFRMVAQAAQRMEHALPFIIQAAILLRRKVGRAALLEQAVSECLADVELLKRPSIRAAMDSSITCVPPERTRALEAYVAETRAHYRTDWSRDLARVVGNVPILAVHGLQDCRVPPATLAEYRAAWPQIEVITVPDQGQLVLFGRWREMLDRLAAMA